MEVELVEVFVSDNSTSIFIRNVGSSQVDVTGVLMDGVYFNLDHVLRIRPGDVSRIMLDQVNPNPCSILVFFDGGGYCRVI